MHHALIQGEWDTQYGIVNGNEMERVVAGL